MKKWIGRLDFDSIRSLSKKHDELPDVPADVDARIITAIKGHEPVRERIVRPLSRRPLVRLALAAATLAVVILPLAYFLFFTSPLVRTAVLFVSGECSVTRDGNDAPVNTATVLATGDAVRTERSSNQAILFGESRLVRLESESEILIQELAGTDIRVGLETGEIFIRSVTTGAKSIPFTVITKNAAARCIGTVFGVRYEDRRTTINVYDGTVYAWPIGNEDESTAVTGGSSIVFGGGTAPEISRLSSVVSGNLASFSGTGLTGVKTDSATIEVFADTDQVLVTCNGVPAGTFATRAVFRVPAGISALTFRKEGYVTVTETVELKAGEKRALRVSLEKEPGSNGAMGSGEPERFVILATTKLYSYSNPDDPAKSGIIGFASAREGLAVVTRSSLFLLDASGRLSWKLDFGEKRRLIFESSPLVFGGRLYASSNYAIVSAETASGKELGQIASPGMIVYGCGMALSGKKAFLPFADGIYALDLASGALSNKPALEIENATTPLVTGGSVYVTSMMKGSISRYSDKGALIADSTLGSFCVSQPVEAGEFIFAGDMAGTLYKFTKSLDPVCTLPLSGGITSILVSGDRLFAFANDGTCFVVSVKECAPVGSIAIGKAFDELTYLTRKPVLLNGNILIGNDDGELQVIDAESGNYVERVKVSEHAVSTAVHQYGGRLFAGTVNGDVVRLDFGYR